MNLIISFYYIINIKFAESYKLIIYMECKFFNWITETKYTGFLLYIIQVSYHYTMQRRKQE